MSRNELKSPEAHNIASLEPLAQCGDALCGEGTSPIFATAEIIIIQTAAAEMHGFRM